MTRTPISLAHSIALLPASEREAWLKSLRPEIRKKLPNSWHFWARTNQLSPWTNWTFERRTWTRDEALKRWSVWLIDAGRGFGKTRSGAEATIEEAKLGQEHFRGHLIGRTAGDMRDIMVEGESGILAKSPPDFRPQYEPSKRRLTWPNGAVATTFTSEEPDQLRGPQSSWIWADELASWKYLDETWDMAMFGHRLGAWPRAVITTTPKPRALLKKIKADKRTFVSSGSTFENGDNLAPVFLSIVRSRYEGTTLGRQELYAEILDETPGALWKRASIDSNRRETPPELSRIVVAIDPAVSSNKDSDETGIIVAGVKRMHGEPWSRGYVLEDLSGRYSPHEWASIAIDAYERHKADRIVAEVNQGGDMVGHTIRSHSKGASVAYSSVHASRGKATRAEPIAALYEQGRIHHTGFFSELEDQLCTWVPGDAKSPDRLDGLVWALSELMLEGGDSVLPVLGEGLDV